MRTRKKKSPTVGKVVPVNRGAAPYKPIEPLKPVAQSTPETQPSANAAGAVAQQQRIDRRPTSTQISVNYEADPTLARIRALGTQEVAAARAEAEALRKKAIIDSGLADIGQEIGLDGSTLQAARENPFSARAEIERQQTMRGRDIDETLNQQGNLFYSGHRANQLSELARSGALAETQLTGDIRSMLGGISGGVREAEIAAERETQRVLEELAAEERMAALQQSYLDALLAGSTFDPYGTGPDVATALGTNVNPLAAPTEEELLVALGGLGSGMAGSGATYGI